MSLLDDVSIVVTPNGYKAGELYAVIPVPTEGAELITNGDFATDSDWDKSPSGVTISGGFANFTSGQDTYVFQDIMVIGKRYIMSLDYNITSITGSAYFGSNGGSGNAILSMTGLTGAGTLSGEITASATKLIVRSSTFSGTVTNVSVKEYTSADMDVTRATAATRVDENGLVNYAEVLGDSALTGNNSNFDTGIGSWVGYNGGTLAHSTDKLEVTLTAVESGASINTNSLISGGQVGKTFKVRARIWQGTTTNTIMYIYIGNVQQSITISSTPTYFEIELTPTTTSNLFIYRPGSNGGVSTFFIDDVTVKEVTRDNVPRIDYTGGGCPHILAEPQRTNLITYSEDFSQWTTFRSSVTTNQIISPNGVLSADKIIQQLGNTSSGGVYIADTLLNSTVYTYSVFLKAGGYNFGLFRIDVGQYAWFDLSNGLVGQINGGGTSSIEYFGNDWYRCSLTFTTTSTSGKPHIYIADADGSLVVSSGDGVKGIYSWGSQVEAGSYPTSYIPTSGSSVTRNQDQFTRDGIGSLINSTEGVLFVEAKTTYDSSESRRITLSDGSISNRVSLEFDESAENKIKAFITLNGASEVLEYNAPDLSIFNKIAIKWKANDFAIWFNGVARDTETAEPRVPTGMTQLSFDGGNGSNFFYGQAKQLQVYKTALTDNQLIQLTGEAGTHFFESYTEMAEALTYTIQ